MIHSIHGFVTVASNMDLHLPDYFRIWRYWRIRKADLTVKFGDFHPDSNPEPSFYLEKKRYRFLDTKIQIQNLEDHAIIQVTNPSYRFRRRVSSNIQKLVGAAIQLKLLEKNALLFHAACLEHDGQGILLVAPSNTGKTYTTKKLVKDGYKYLSDDTTIINYGSAYAWPSLQVPVQKKTTIGTIYFLEAGEQSAIRELDCETALQKAYAANVFDSACSPPLIKWYSYKNPGFKLKSLMDRQTIIFTDLIRGTPCYLLTANNKQFHQLIRKHNT